jgi:hypothetical protein
LGGRRRRRVCWAAGGLLCSYRGRGRSVRRPTGGFLTSRRAASRTILERSSRFYFCPRTRRRIFLHRIKVTAQLLNPAELLQPVRSATPKKEIEQIYIAGGGSRFYRSGAASEAPNLNHHRKELAEGFLENTCK